MFIMKCRNYLVFVFFDIKKKIGNDSKYVYKSRKRGILFVNVI